ncbi:MAG: hypothetical protein H7247_01920 [Polaromonas sp.]|nr:hypothetical protein [Gemmatimonadaceae bacterium]
MIGCGEAAESAAGEDDPVGLVDQPVEDGTATGGSPMLVCRDRDVFYCALESLA